MIRFTTWCCPVSRSASRNLLHWSSVSSRSSTASLLLYAPLCSLRISSCCLRVNTSRRRRWSSRPKSGSMMSERRVFKFTMLANMEAGSILTTIHFWLQRHWILYKQSRVHCYFNLAMFHKIHSILSKELCNWNTGCLKRRTLKYRLS